jgi:2-polyprenyl-3-methyl-5-hydroxy-6-metoxy-1,4-benzoquinol methylase
MNKSKIKNKFDHLEYYLENEISPVRQDIENLNQHLDRRGALYTSIGLPELLIEGKKVLEVGPGSGHNSLYVASCNPQLYDLLEPNKSAWKDIEKLYSENAKKIKLIQPNIIKKKLEDFDTNEKYDIVISEGWLGINDNERQLMKKLSEFVKPNGILVTTISPSVGYFSNLIRRILSWKIVDCNGSLQDNTSKLMKAYTSHLDTMKDMSRHAEDWCQDTLLNPGWYTLSTTPSMFIEDIGDNFSIYGSYPKITMDWRWYKSLYGSGRRFNEVFLEAYYRNIHNFFDHNIVLESIDKEFNLELENCVFTLNNLAKQRENNGNTVIDYEVIHSINTVFDKLIEIHPYWSKPLGEVINLIKGNNFSVEDLSKMQEFKQIFGRELMYVSAIKE